MRHPTSFSGRPVCPRRVRARSCGGFCAKSPRMTSRIWAIRALSPNPRWSRTSSRIARRRSRPKTTNMPRRGHPPRFQPCWLSGSLFNAGGPASHRSCSTPPYFHPARHTHRVHGILFSTLIQHLNLGFPIWYGTSWDFAANSCGSPVSDGPFHGSSAVSKGHQRRL